MTDHKPLRAAVRDRTLVNSPIARAMRAPRLRQPPVVPADKTFADPPRTWFVGTARPMQAAPPRVTTNRELMEKANTAENRVEPERLYHLALHGGWNWPYRNNGVGWQQEIIRNFATENARVRQEETDVVRGLMSLLLPVSVYDAAGESQNRANERLAEARLAYRARLTTDTETLGHGLDIARATSYLNQLEDKGGWPFGPEAIIRERERVERVRRQRLALQTQRGFNQTPAYVP